MGKISLVEGIAFLFELLNRRGHIHGIPDNDGIGDQIQATGLMSQHRTTGMTQVALIRDQQERSEVMQRLAFVQLPQDPPPLLLIGIPPHDVQGARQPSILLEDQGEGVFLGIGLELLHQQRRGHPAELQGTRGPQQLIPPVEHALPLDPARDMGLKARIALHVDGTRCKEAAVGEVPQPRGEAVAQQIEEGKDDLGGPGRIRGMFLNRQLRFVIAEFVKHIGRVADGHGHVCGAILRELIRGPTVKGDPQAIAERRGKRAGVPGFARHRKPLAIGGGEDAAPPELAEWEVIVIVDQRGEGGFEGFLAEVPGGTLG